MCSYHGDLSRLQKREGETEARRREEIREAKSKNSQATGQRQDLQLDCPV